MISAHKNTESIARSGYDEQWQKFWSSIVGEQADATSRS
jgi:hypothetical protein